MPKVRQAGGVRAFLQAPLAACAAFSAGPGPGARPFLKKGGGAPYGRPRRGTPGAGGPFFERAGGPKRLFRGRVLQKGPLRGRRTAAGRCRPARAPRRASRQTPAQRNKGQAIGEGCKKGKEGGASLPFFVCIGVRPFKEGGVCRLCGAAPRQGPPAGVRARRAAGGRWRPPPYGWPFRCQIPAPGAGRQPRAPGSRCTASRRRRAAAARWRP